MKHKIYSFDLKQSSVRPIAEMDFDTAQEAHKIFTKVVAASFAPAEPMRILWKNEKGRTVAEYTVKIPL